MRRHSLRRPFWKRYFLLFPLQYKIKALNRTSLRGAIQTRAPFSSLKKKQAYVLLPLKNGAIPHDSLCRKKQEALPVAFSIFSLKKMLCWIPTFAKKEPWKG